MAPEARIADDALPAVFGRARALAALGGWGAVALLFAAHTWLGYGADGRRVPFGRAMYWSVAEWATWAVLTPAVFAAARRFPLTGGRPVRAALALAFAGLAVAVAQIGLEAAVDRLTTAAAGPAVSVRSWLSGGASPLAVDLPYLLRRKLGFDYAVFWVLVVVAHAADWHALYRRTQLDALRLEAALARSRLDALQAQLQPHFLFNTLNAISALVRVDPDAADRMLGNLSDLLRSVLARAGTREVPLGEELALVDAYLAIEHARLGERLRVALGVEPSARAALVPPLLLQPLVENAVRHGVHAREEGGNVAVVARRAGDALVLEVRDDGPGPTPPTNGRRGLGLDATRERLATLYGDGASLTLGRDLDGCTVARVCIPWRAGRAPAPAGQL